MPIYVLCPKCRTEYQIKHKKCPKCGTPKPSSNKATYRIQVVYKGKRVRKFFTGVPIQTLKEIEIKIKQSLVEGKYLEKEKDLTFEDIALVYFNHTKSTKKKRSFEREEELYKQYIKPFVSEKKLKEITKLDIEKIRDSVLEKGLSSRTAQYTIHVIRRIYNFAIERELYSGKNPATKIKIALKDNRRVRFLTKEEADILLRELKKRSQQTYEIAYLSLHTGMRASEIFNLRWSDIDFNNELIYIKDPKSGENRVAYMTENIKQLLADRHNRLKPSPDELVFKARGGGKITRISKAFERAVEKLGLNNGITDSRDKVVFHTLRHTFASWLVMQGTPIYTVKELMGHKTLAMTERYSHLASDAKRKAVVKLFSED